MTTRSTAEAERTSDDAAVQVRDLTILMSTLVRDLRTSFDALASRNGLTLALADLLWQIEPDDPLPMRSAAERISCDPSNVTFLADRLEERGLVERRPSPGDRRIKLLVLTDEGERLRERLLEESVATTPFATLSANERTQLRRLLRKVAGCTAAQLPTG